MTTPLVKHRLTALLRQAAQLAQEQQLLPPLTLPELAVEHPQSPEHGDYASSLALRLARAARQSPMAIAQTVARFIPATEEVARVTVAPPGFINLTLRDAWLAQQVQTILELGSRYGDLNLGAGERVQVEFVSANPTGPLHVGNGRGAVLGSTLANLLRSAGYQVQREYYINDAGSQMEAFYHTLHARYRQALGLPAELPTEGYAGAYMVELAREIAAEVGDRYLQLPEAEALTELGRRGMAKVLATIREDLERLGVEFDQWFSEQGLYDGGQYQRALEILRQKGYLEQREGALWFVSTALGESKDNVVVRSNGSPTYFASDIAYHYNKFAERGFRRVVNIWGADHQGHVSRMRAVVGALGFEPEQLQIIIAQMVSLRRGAEQVRLSKRTGEIITLREVIDEVGPNACRYFFLARSADSQMDFDLELAVRQAPENPVYYVQYAHARIASILRHAAELGLDGAEGDVSLLTSPPELALIRKMLLLPELVEAAALNLEPHHLPHYALELATAFHLFYRDCRVLPLRDEPVAPINLARLKLVRAAQIVLAKTLHLMGMTAPERM